MPNPANSVAVQAGSLVVTGTLTSFVAAENDLFTARGAAVPIARRDGPNQITLKQPWPLETLAGEESWSILSLGEYWRSAISINRRLVELLAKWEVVSPFRFDEAGPLSGRSAYNDQPKGFVYAAVDQIPIRIYIKLANTNSESDWSLAIYLGSGGDVEFEQALAQERQQRETAVSTVSGRIDGVDAARRIGIGPLYDDAALTVQTFNGASAAAYRGRTAGFTIPAGSTGVNSLVLAQLPQTPVEIAQMAGCTVLISASFETNANFSRTVTPLMFGHEVTETRNIQVSAIRRVIEFTTVLTGTEATLQPYWQVLLNSAAQAAEKFVLIDVAMEIIASPSERLSLGEVNLRAGLTRAVEPRRFGIGPVYDALSFAPQVFNGATIRSVGVRNAGFTIPAGQTGEGSLVLATYPVDASARPLLAGRTVRVVIGLDTSPDFSRVLSVVLADHNITLARSGQVSAIRRVIEFTAPLTGAETALSLVVQVAESKTTGQESFVFLTDLAIEIVGSSSDVSSLAEENLRVALAASGRQIAEKVVAPVRIGIGPLYDAAVLIAQGNGGGAIATYNGRQAGFTIPTGQTGYQSLVLATLPMSAADISLMKGSTVRIVAGFDTNPNFTRIVTPQMIGHTVTETRNEQVSTSRRIIEFTAVLSGTEDSLQPFWQVLFNPVSQVNETFILTDLFMDVVATTSDVTTPAEQTKSVADARLLSKLLSTVGSSESYAVVLTVSPDGTKQFTSPKAALASITDAAPNKRYLILIHPGVYTDVQYAMKDWVDLAGTDRDRCWLKGYQAPNTDPFQILLNSTIQMDTNTRLYNLKITCQNMRYPIHADSNGVRKDVVQRLYDCYVEHLGNQEARDYQSSQGNDPNTVWSSYHAWGFGTSSGLDCQHERCTFRTPGDAFYVHNNLDFDKPSLSRVVNCNLITTSDGGDVCTVQNLGSGVGDVVEFIGNQANGALHLFFLPWLTTKPEMQIANRVHLQKITGYGNTPMPYHYTSDGARALRIESLNTGPGSSVTVSGDAVPIIFGEVVNDKSGGGLPAAVYGTWEVAGVDYGSPIISGRNSLAWRIGDRSNAPKTLIVTVDGGAPMTVTFDVNYMGLSNTTMLAVINQVIGAKATASLFDVVDLWRPNFTDEETVMLNSSSVALRRKQAVAYNTSIYTGRVMTQADPATRFAGIALENIPPGQSGRVKTRGAVRVSMDVDRSDSGGFNFGDTFGVGPTPGRFVRGAAVPLMTACNTLDVRWERRLT